MRERVLITGGGGFIGSHLADELLRKGWRVRALDNLDAQVHGESRARPPYLDDDVELVVGDVRDRDAIEQALVGVDTVVHLAATVGIGQSMYEIERYTDVNNRGTAVLLEVLTRHPVRRLVVASDMSIYGEGLYHRSDGTSVECVERSREQFARGRWEARGPDGEALAPMPTPENKRPTPASIYGLSKYDQERMCLMIGEAYNIPTVALRFFNVYGTRQAVSNPYTGVLAIFASRLLNDKSPLILEDGFQRRDFVNVRDAVHAVDLALEARDAPGNVFNIGSGESHTVRQIAERIAVVLGRDRIKPDIPGEYRVGDIRHCFADITRARGVLGYSPEVSLDDGLVDLAAWLEDQVAIDRVSEMHEELSQRGLMV